MRKPRLAPERLKAKIPTPLRQYTEGNSEVKVGGTTAGEALRNLTREYPDLRQHLYTGDGKLRSFVNVYKGDEDIRYLGGQETEVTEGDLLAIIPSITGGRKEDYTKISSVCTGLSVVWGTAAAGMAFIPVIGAGPAATAGVASGVLAAIAWASNELASDPPRMDFEEESFFTREEFPSGRAANDLDAALRDFMKVQAHLRKAMGQFLTAHERQQGAASVLANESLSTHARESATEAEARQALAVDHNKKAISELAQDALDEGQRVNNAYQAIVGTPVPGNTAEIKRNLKRGIDDVKRQHKLDEFGITDFSVVHRAIDRYDPSQPRPATLLDEEWFATMRNIRDDPGL